MLNKLLSLANPLINSTIAAKGLGKIDKRLQNFFIGAGLAGYGTNEAMDYIRNQFSDNSSQQDTSRLKNRSNSGLARPDEMGSLREAEINEQIPNLVKGGLSAATGLTGGLSAISDFENLGSTSEGRSNTEGMPRVQEGAKEENSPKKVLSPLSKEGLEEQTAADIEPEKLLFAFSQLVKQTNNPQQAADRLRTFPLYRKMIPRLEQETGMDFVDWALNELAARQQVSQSQNSSGGKQQFMSELSRLGQMLQGLRK